MSSITQAATRVDLSCVATEPFAVTVQLQDIDNNPLTGVSDVSVNVWRDGAELPDLEPTITNPDTGEYQAAWTGDQTGVIGQLARCSYSFECQIDSSGPVAIIAGVFRAPGPNIPGASTTTVPVMVDVGGNTVHVTVNLGGGGAASSLGIWLYGDGSDGPLAFTATPRAVTDALLTVGSDILTSATADFTDADIGLQVSDANGDAGGLQAIPGAGARIKSITSSIVAVMTAPANANANGEATDLVVIGDSTIQPGSYSSITIPTGATAVRNIAVPNTGFPLLCSGDYYINGSVDLRDGEGGQSGNSGPGTDAFNVNWQGPAPGSGGAGSTTNVGDTPGGYGGGTFASNNYTRQVFAFMQQVPESTGGASGAGDGVNNGGDGGVSGATLMICARSIVHGPSASYLLTGGIGGAGGTGGGTGGEPIGNCGGGGGGPDGWWITLSDSLIGAPTVIGGGGAGGAGSGTGADGQPGQPGFGVHYTPSGVITQTP